MRTEVTSFYRFPDDEAAARAARVLESILGLRDDAETEDEIADSDELFAAANRVEDQLGFGDGVEVLGVARDGPVVAVGLRVHASVDERLEEGTESAPGSEGILHPTRTGPELCPSAQGAPTVGAPSGWGPRIEAALADLCVALGGKDPRTWPLPPAGWRERLPAVGDVVVDGVGSTVRAQARGRGTAIVEPRPFVAEDALEGALRACIARGAGFIAVDLTGVEIVPARAFAVLATALAHARAQGGDLVLFGLEAHVRRNLDGAGLPEPPAVVADEGQALRALGAQ